MRRRALTLLEISVSVLIGAIVMLAASRMLSSGMKSSTKGAAHLTNVQNTSMLMAQIEEDLQRAYRVDFAPAGTPEASLQMYILEDRGEALATYSIIYSVNFDKTGKEQGIRRQQKNLSTDVEENHFFCKGLDIVQCQFTRLDLDKERIGYLVVLKTATPPNATEEFELQRFVLCRNHASNTFLLGWQDQ